jgi:hypothetical protein
MSRIIKIWATTFTVMFITIATKAVPLKETVENIQNGIMLNDDGKKTTTLKDLG